MNQTEILSMLHNIIANNQQYTTWTVSTPHIVALVNQAVEAEREACIDIVARHGGSVEIEAAIRARGKA